MIIDDEVVLEHAAQHDTENRRRDRYAVLLEHESDHAITITATSNGVLLIANAPTTQNSMIIGISTLRGTFRICFDALMPK